MSAPQLSLVVCTYRRPQPLLRLLSAVEAQHRRPEEVIVVDGSPEGTTEEALRSSGRLAAIDYLRVGPEERGLTRQRNVGIERSRGRRIAFLDDDTVPEPGYFAEVDAAFDRHPEAVAIGGYLTEVEWRRCHTPGAAPLGRYRHGGWERREDLRWRLRRLLGLDSPLPPGWMPPSGHARPVGHLPPDGEDHRVELLMGGAASWRRGLLEELAFSPEFEGYGLYEDLDFCLRAGERGPLFLCTRARVAHLHEALGRPHPLRYGRMVTRNGWLVWRRRWPEPPVLDRLRWWATTLLLTGCRFADGLRGPSRRAAFLEAVGRLLGAGSVWIDPPERRPLSLQAAIR